MNQSLPKRLAKALALIAIVIFVLLPFNEFLTTWIASSFGHLDFWRIYKVILIALLVPFIVYLVFCSTSLRKWVLKDWLLRVICLYSLLTLLVGVLAHRNGRVNLFALSDGLVIDLGFLLFFLVMLVVGAYSGFIKKHWQSIVLWPASIVVFFGIAQLFLPIDFLRHFGYGPSTIPAYSTVDQKLQYRRIQSTLRGADPLGAYLVLVIPAFLIGLRRQVWQRSVMIVLSLVVLFYTYSRSAYIGLAITLALLFYWGLTKTKQRKQLTFIYLILGLIFIVGVIGLRYNQTAENIFFHTSNASNSSTSSNAVRAGALETGIKQVFHQPLGGGTGTAGPASVHNNHQARIAENYFVQIGQEVGWLGLALFVVINVLVAIRLWRRRSDQLSRLLLASLVGITFIGMVSHVWADDTLSLLWWGLAGIALSPAILKEHKQLRHETNKKTGSPSIKATP